MFSFLAAPNLDWHYYFGIIFLLVAFPDMSFPFYPDIEPALQFPDLWRGTFYYRQVFLLKEILRSHFMFFYGHLS